MNIAKYDPFRELRGLQDEMTRLFTGALPAQISREEMLNGSWMPSVDIFENKENLILEADLPGMTRDDFDLTIENNVITLKGERRFEKKAEGDNYHRVERAYGSFTRSFTLPQTVKAEGATADFKNGILLVTLPKREESKARRIEISANDAQSEAIETHDKFQSAAG